MTNKYLLVLGIGHILGDFYFQTDEMAKKKDTYLIGVVEHSIEYAVSLLIVMAPIICYGMIIAAIFLSVMHFFVDVTKYVLLKKRIIKKSAKVFIYDQAFHLLCILITAYMMYVFQVKISSLSFIDSFLHAFGVQKEVIARWVLAILFIHKPSNILIQQIVNKNNNEENVNTSNSRLILPKSTQVHINERDDIRAGRKIGSIERLIMLLFISMEQYTALGVVLTAKSIARFDRIAKEEKFAEYYLLGTLISTACVVLCKVVLL